VGGRDSVFVCFKTGIITSYYLSVHHTGEAPLSVSSSSDKKGFRRSFGSSLREPLLDDSFRK